MHLELLILRANYISKELTSFLFTLSYKALDSKSSTNTKPRQLIGKFSQYCQHEIINWQYQQLMGKDDKCWLGGCTHSAHSNKFMMSIFSRAVNVKICSELSTKITDTPSQNKTVSISKKTEPICTHHNSVWLSNEGTIMSAQRVTKAHIYATMYIFYSQFMDIITAFLFFSH